MCAQIFSLAKGCRMGWREFQSNKAALMDKVYKEDKETHMQATLSTSSSLSLIEPPINEENELEKNMQPGLFIPVLDKEDKVKTLIPSLINGIDNHDTCTAFAILPPIDNQPTADNAYWVNIKPLIDCYPAQPPAEILSWMMQAVEAAPEQDQVRWFELLEAWARHFHDKGWADKVLTRLMYYPAEVQTRKDFEIAKKMFAGHDSRIVSNGNVISVGT
jgi:hypothetical protein